MKPDSKVNILLIENNIADIKSAKELISSNSSYQSEIEAVADFDEALNVLSQTNEIDLIIIQLTSKKSSSVDKVQHLQQSYPMLPIIGILDDDDNNLGVELIKTGLQDCLINGEFNQNQIRNSILYSIVRKKCQVELEQRVTHDSLTGLSRRALFIQHLEHTLHLARRNNTGVVVIFIDLDHFKKINDTYGHLVGDRLLIQIAEKLQANCRKSDLISRYAGDEFAIILENLSDGISISAVTNKLSNIGKTPFEIVDPENDNDSISVSITLSMGVSVFPADTEMVYELINCADIAMYEAKGRGRNQLVFYSETKHKKNNC